MLERLWRKGNPLTLLVGMQLVQPLCRTVWRFLKKLGIELPYNPAVPIIGIHTEETRTERDTCTPMFIAALFINYFIDDLLSSIFSDLSRNSVFQILDLQDGSSDFLRFVFWIPSLFVLLYQWFSHFILQSFYSAFDFFHHVLDHFCSLNQIYKIFLFY